MMKFYTKLKESTRELQPKKETIRYILDFSASYKVFKVKKKEYIELHLN